VFCITASNNGRFILFTVKIETGFFAFHQVLLGDGTLEPLHSHDWQVATEVFADQLDPAGVVMDFQLLKGMVNNITAKIGDSRMKDIEFFKQNSCSTENIAKYIYERLESQLPTPVKLQSVTVTEMAGCSVKFSK